MGWEAGDLVGAALNGLAVDGDAEEAGENVAEWCYVVHPSLPELDNSKISEFIR